MSKDATTATFSGVELAELDSPTRQAVSEAREGRIGRDDLAGVSQLLTVTAESFDEYRERPWFKKAWALVSGERGRFTDRSIQNLAAVQVGALRVFGELLEDAGALKDDLVVVLRRLDALDSDTLALKEVVLAFNAKYENRFHLLAQEAQSARTTRAVGFGLTAFALLAGAALAFVPALRPYWPVGVIAWTVAGIGLVVLAARSIRRPPLSLSRRARGTRNRRPELPAPDPHAAAFLGLGESIAPEDARVFRIGGAVEDLKGYFTLNSEEQRLLFSLQYHVAVRDAKKSPDRAAKLDWLDRWTQSLDDNLDRPVVTDKREFERGLEEVQESGLPLPKAGTILLEAATFKPYFSLGDGCESEFEFDENVQAQEVRRDAPKMGVSRALLDEVVEAYREALEAIPPSTFWKTVAVGIGTAVLVAITGGLAAPAIGALIGGAMGLGGAAAVSAGLAFLGGGAVAAGGFGMAGGVAVLIGGGSILGAGAGTGIVRLLGTSHALVLDQLAKLEAVSEVFLCRLPDGESCVDAVVQEIETTRRAVEREIQRIDTKRTPSQDEIDRQKELRKGLPYYRRAAERIEAVASRAG